MRSRHRPHRLLPLLALLLQAGDRAAAPPEHRRQWIELPLHTKAYVLAKTATPSTLLGLGSRQAAVQGVFGYEKICVFCGSPVAD